MQSVLRSVVEVRTGQDRQAGLALLREPSWSGVANLQAGVRGYADAVGKGTNWRELRREVGEIANSWTKVSMNDGVQLDVTVAQEWAKHDAQAALSWFVDERSGQGLEGNGLGYAWLWFGAILDQKQKK